MREEGRKCEIDIEEKGKTGGTRVGRSECEKSGRLFVGKRCASRRGINTKKQKETLGEKSWIRRRSGAVFTSDR